jgi:uncharacterized membrane protein
MSDLFSWLWSNYPLATVAALLGVIAGLAGAVSEWRGKRQTRKDRPHD